MALTWRNVDGPQLSVRDLALAGQQIDQSFSRLSETLAAREAALTTKATDAAIAGRLAIQDPNQMGTLDPTTLDPRANLRAVLEAENAHRASLTQRAQQNEQLLNSQAAAKYASEGIPLLMAAQNGDAAAIEAINTRAKAEPEYARWLGSMTGDFANSWDTGIDNRRADRDSEAQNKNDAIRTGIASAGLRLEQQRYALEQQDRDAMVLGTEFAENWMTSDRTAASTEDAIANLVKREDFLKLPENAQRAALARITDPNRGRESLMRATAADLQTELTPRLTASDGKSSIPEVTLGSALNQLTALDQDAEAARVIEQNRFYDEKPVLRTFDRLRQIQEASAKNPEAAPTAESVYAIADERDISTSQLESIQKEYNLSYEELTAILGDGSIRDMPFFSTTLELRGKGVDSIFEGGEKGLKEAARAYSEARNEDGYTENLQGVLDRRISDLGITGTQQQARDLQAQLTRAVRSGAPTADLTARLDALLKRRGSWAQPRETAEPPQR
jgi:hypothetical protein